MWITPVRTADQNAVAASLIREYGERYDFDFTDPAWLAEIEDPLAKYAAPDGELLVAELDGQPAGVVAFMRLDERSCTMKRMFVTPRFRRRGVARVLALELIGRAEDAGYARMAIDTPANNERALGLYRSLGFTDTAPYREPGHDHVHHDWAFLDLALPRPDEIWFDHTRMLLETAYLASDNVYRQSGHSGDAARWELTRGIVADAIDRDGTFIDIGCANGLLMETVTAWCADRGLKIEPYGVDISERLAAVARERLPRWADRIEVGNAWTWEPPMRFDFVSTRIEYVPTPDRPAFARRLLERFVAPGGRLIVIGLDVGRYVGAISADDLRAWGLPVGGELERRDADGTPVSRAAWIERA